MWRVSGKGGKIGEGWKKERNIARLEKMKNDMKGKGERRGKGRERRESKGQREKEER